MSGSRGGAEVLGSLRAFAAAVMLAACGTDGGDPMEGGAVATLAAESASNPTVAFDPASGRTYVAWVGVEEAKYAVFVASTDGSLHGPWRRVRANDIPGDAAPHAQAPAQVAVGPERTVYVLWQNNTPVEGRRFPASDLRLAVSTDGGRSFRPAVTVNEDAGGPPSSSHTFHDLVVGRDGTVYVSWIDSRELGAVRHARISAGGGHLPHAAGASRAGNPVAAGDEPGAAGSSAGPEIRVARSTDGGATFEPSMVVDADACPCCRTSIALGPDGSLHVAWRKLYPGGVRDVVVARAAPGSLRFDPPVRVHRDDWVFPACPHAGPSLAVNGDGRLLVGWYTGREGRQGLWYAVSEDGGRSFASPAPVLTADWVPPSQVRMAFMEDERVLAAWEDRTGEKSVLRTASSLRRGPLRPDVGWSAPGSDPAVASAGGAAIVAWLDGGAVRMVWLDEE